MTLSSDFYDSENFASELYSGSVLSGDPSRRAKGALFCRIRIGNSALPLRRGVLLVFIGKGWQ